MDSDGVRNLGNQFSWEIDLICSKVQQLQKGACKACRYYSPLGLSALSGLRELVHGPAILGRMCDVGLERATYTIYFRTGKEFDGLLKGR